MVENINVNGGYVICTHLLTEYQFILAQPRRVGFYFYHLTNFSKHFFSYTNNGRIVFKQIIFFLFLLYQKGSFEMYCSVLFFIAPPLVTAVKTVWCHEIREFSYPDNKYKSNPMSKEDIVGYKIFPKKDFPILSWVSDKKRIYLKFENDYFETRKGYECIINSEKKAHHIDNYRRGHGTLRPDDPKYKITTSISDIVENWETFTGYFRFDLETDVTKLDVSELKAQLKWGYL